MSFWELVIILIPFFFMFFIASMILLNTLNSHYEIKKIFKNNSRSAEEIRAMELINKNTKPVKLTFVQKMNSKMHLFGLNYKFETILLILFLAGIGFAVFTHVVLKAGAFLMAYIALIVIFIGYQFIQGRLEKIKDNLTVEFLEKLRDLSSYLSAGKSVPVAIGDCIENGLISPVLKREFISVQGDIALGRPMSEAFMNMYIRLDIPEAKVFAQTLGVYEENGGNLISIMQSSDRFFSQKLSVKNEQRVITTEMKSSQKFMVGIPLAFVFLLAIVNPSFYGDFYATTMGQVVGVVAITMLIIGVFVSRQMSKI